jgi:hypothetical protein
VWPMNWPLPVVLCASASLVLAPPSTGTAARPCSASEVGRTVRTFFRAFNAGDRMRLDAVFARDDGDGDAGTPSFQWYSIGPPGARFGAAAENRATLVRYFLARHRRGERLRLVSLHLGANAYGYFHLTFHLYRRARDLPRPGVFEGKGAAICAGPRARIAVWSVGPRVRGA